MMISRTLLNAEVIYDFSENNNLASSQIEYLNDNKLIKIVDILGRGPDALRELNAKKGLGFDDWDINFYIRSIDRQTCRM